MSLLSASQLAAISPPHPPIRASSEPAPSTPANDDYEEISLDTLFKIPTKDIEEFHDYLRTIPFSYKNLAPSILGRQLMTEADARMFFDSSILLAVWPVALAMVPTERDADLVLMSEKTYHGVRSSPPDVSIITYGGAPNEYPTVAQIEYRGPRALEAFRNVIRAISEGRTIIPPTNWEVVTRQLRKYATETRCRSILCSDESDAYIFIFPIDESSERVYYLHASNDGTGSLTLREAVLFLIYAGIRLNSPFTLRYVHTHLCPICQVCCCLIYCSILELY